MAGTVCERTEERSGGIQGVNRVYWVPNATDEDDALTAAIAVAPTTIGSYQKLTATYDELNTYPNGNGDYSVTVTWGIPQAAGGGAAQPQNTVEYQFNYVAPSITRKYSLATIQSYPSGAEQYDNAINISGPGNYDVEGVDLSPPSETYVLNYSAAGSAITTAYQAIVQKLCGTVNESAYNGAAAGELLLARVSGGIRRVVSLDGEPLTWSISFGFAYSENRTAAGGNPINLWGETIDKKGWEYLWALYEAQNTTDGPAQKFLSAHVEKVYEEGDFSQLNLPGIS